MFKEKKIAYLVLNKSKLMADSYGKEKKYFVKYIYCSVILDYRDHEDNNKNDCYL